MLNVSARWRTTLVVRRSSLDLICVSLVSICSGKSFRLELRLDLLEQPRLGVGPLAFDGTFGDAQVLRDFLIG